MITLPVDPMLSYGRMRMLLYQKIPDLTVMSDLLDGDLDGVYCAASNTIIIDRRLTYTQKHCTLVHELVHRHYGDDTSQGTCGAYAEQRCRRETARLLINETDYRRAEAMYDGDTWLIAEELNVTPTIVEDYRQLVIPTLSNRHQLITQDR